jgi:hypothetical protein
MSLRDLLDAREQQLREKLAVLPSDGTIEVMAYVGPKRGVVKNRVARDWFSKRDKVIVAGGRIATIDECAWAFSFEGLRWIYSLRCSELEFDSIDRAMRDDTVEDALDAAFSKLKEAANHLGRLRDKVKATKEAERQLHEFQRGKAYFSGEADGHSGRLMGDGDGQGSD